MSVIAVKIYKKKIEIGADSITVYGDTQTKSKSSKIRKINKDWIVAGCGGANIMDLFFEFCTNHAPKNNTPESITSLMIEFNKHVKEIGSFDINDMSLLMVHKKKAFAVDGVSATEIEEFMADGAGMDYALTALHLGKTVKEAIAVACELSIYCERPINVFTIKL